MARNTPRIGIVRRVTQESGGDTRYLNRFAVTLKNQGFESVLFTTENWTESKDFTQVFRLPDGSPLAFANAVKKADPKLHCEILLSFERVWDCDFYRAEDGVQRAWLDRRYASEGAFRSSPRAFNFQANQILKLEDRLFSPETKTAVIANAEFVKHEILQYYGKPSDRVHVVYNGYKPPAKKGDPRTEIRSQLGFDDHVVMMLFAGSSWERNGLAYAIKAAGLLQHEGVRLVVTGKGKPRGMPRGPVTYLGEVSEMSAYYDAADLFIHPTLYDPFSDVSLEAASHGLPVITTTANGFAEIMLHSHQGEVVEDPADVEKLGAAIINWLNADKRAKARDDIRTWARGFNLKENVDKTLEIILPNRGTI